MAGFTETALERKLADLNNSQQSIQTLSLWLIHHRKHHAPIVKVWYRELIKAKEHRKLTFMYLANDVIQNSKRKGPEFGKEFGLILRKAFEHLGCLGADEKTAKGILRLLQVWEERGVYDAQLISELKTAYTTAASRKQQLTAEIRDKGSSKQAVAPVGDAGEPPPKKARRDKEVVARKKAVAVKEKAKGQQKKEKKHIEMEVEVDGQKEVHVKLSPQPPAGDPPEPDELIKALQDLENSASGDAGIRERIASLPPEVSEVSLLGKIQDKTAADNLSHQVMQAVELLTSYNQRLQKEMDDRKNLSRMLNDFIQGQKDLLVQAEDRLEEYREKLQKVQQVRQELRSHLQNLPDLTKLPSVTGGLAPLPSAGDLFNIQT